MEVSKIGNIKKFDKEYSTQYPIEHLFLKESGINYTFVKKDNEGLTVWKYKKTEELFLALAKFYRRANK